MKQLLILSALLLIKISIGDPYRQEFHFPAPIDTLEADAVKYNSSYYHPTSKQCGNTPHITATGLFIDTLFPPKIVAVSRDLDSLIGRKIEVLYPQELAGEWHVADRMNKRWRKKLDFMLAPGEKLAFDSVVVRVLN
jgi:hypothetical protein